MGSPAFLRPMGHGKNSDVKNDVESAVKVPMKSQEMKIAE